MKLTKIQYKKLEKLILIARKPAKVSNYKFIYTTLHMIENSCQWRALPKNMENGKRFARNLVDSPQMVQLPKLLLSFFKTLILEAMKK